MHNIQGDAVGAALKLSRKGNGFLSYLLKNKWFYILLTPGLVYLFIFNYIPMYGVVIAFQKFDIIKGIWKSQWVGLDNFQRLFSTQGFYQVFYNSIIISLYRIVWGFPAPVILALMLNEVRRLCAKKILQTIYYLPHFISWVVVTGMIYNFLSPNGGLVNYVLSIFGAKPVAFLQKPQYFRSIVVISDIWKETGWGTIMYLAALSGINPELYEAALIDGAKRLQLIRYITLPGIMNTVIVVLVLRMGSVLRNGFEQIFLLYNPLVINVADVFETYIYRLGIMEGNYDLATAVGLLQSVVGFFFIWFANSVAKKYSEGGALW